MGRHKTQIGPCDAENCNREKHSWNLCRIHYNRLSKNGRLDLIPKTINKKPVIEFCILEDCNKKTISRGFCSKHYRAFRAWLDKDRSFEDRAKINKQKDSGYTLLYLPDHPDCSVSGLIMEHRVIMEKMIGRRLVLNENVHHKNGVRNDNRPENLELWSSRQPKGQRIEDKVKYAMEILNQYAPHFLAGDK